MYAVARIKRRTFVQLRIYIQEPEGVVDKVPAAPLLADAGKEEDDRHIARNVRLGEP